MTVTDLTHLMEDLDGDASPDGITWEEERQWRQAARILYSGKSPGRYVRLIKLLNRGGGTAVSRRAHEKHNA